MKKSILSLIILLIVVAAVVAWLLLGSGTSFTENKKYLYVYTGGANKAAVINYIEKHNLLQNPGIFELLSSQSGVWKRLKPGRYEIEQGQSLISIVRMLRNNRQTPVNLVINKLRTNEDVAGVLGKNFEVDSTEIISYINNEDSLAKLNVDYNTLMTLIIPNTYTMFWNSTPTSIFKRLKSERDNFWERNGRTGKAKKLGFTPNQVYTISSIVEEETNKQDEKGNVSSVYINRFKSGMPLGADPTIKFAMKDFGLKRIYRKYLDVESPYNTYKHTGLPPGPICTPSSKTIDAVLNSPQTSFMYFVAKSDFSGYHTFSTSYPEHLQHAREYQQALDELILRKQNSAKSSL